MNACASRAESTPHASCLSVPTMARAADFVTDLSPVLSSSSKNHMKTPRSWKKSAHEREGCNLPSQY